MKVKIINLLRRHCERSEAIHRKLEQSIDGLLRYARNDGKLLWLIPLLLTSCAVGPNYVRPVVTTTAKFKEAKGKAFIPEQKKDWKIAQPRDDIDRGEWWKIFNDPQLNDLEAQLNLFNQNIANACANYLQAREIVNEARAAFFPTLQAVLNILRQRSGGGSTAFFSTTPTGGTTTGAAATGSASAPVTRTSYSGFLYANWEPDIWGLVRRTVEGNMAAAESLEALLAATRLSAQGALAQYYFELRTLDMDQKYLDNIVAGYRKQLQYTRNQYGSGVADQPMVVQAKIQLETAEAQALNNGILRGQYEHAIAVLIGRPPAAFALPFSPLTAKPPVIPVSVPTVLLERRPDIAQAERLVQQASAQIGIAIAAYFPTLNLSGTGSAGAISLAKLFTHPAIGWSYGLQLAETIFDGGFRDAAVRAAKDAYTAQVAAYRQTVLTAFQDVEDNLIALRILEQVGAVQNKAAANAAKELQFAMNQYKAGIVDYATVVSAQIAFYTAKRAAYDTTGLQMSAAAALVKSLGGGWCSADIDRLLISPKG